MKRFLHKADTVVFLDGDDIRRAPMAAAVFESLVKRHPILKLWDISVCSAGSGEFTVEDAPPHPLAVLAMHSLGLDIASHKAKVLSLEMLRGASIVVAMEQKHINYVTRRFSAGYPGYCSKMVHLLPYLGSDFEIESLIGATGIAQYAEFCRRLVDTYCLRLQELTVYETMRPLLLRGAGLGTGAVQGRAKVVHAATEASALRPGDILVCPSSHEAQLYGKGCIRSLGGIITDSVFETHHLMGHEIAKIPCIGSTGTATHLLKDAQMITLDATSGMVYAEVDAW